MKRSGFKNRGKPLRRYVGLPRSSNSNAGSGRTGEGGSVVSSAGRPRAACHRVPADVAAIVEERSGGSCEIRLPECRVRPIQKHHRITQKSGGRHGVAAARSDRPSNILAACPRCHDTITRLPLWAKRWAHGWALNENDEPSQRPVLRRGELGYLTDDGRFVPYEEACA